MANYQELIDFVDRAKRSRKYPENTAYALVGALRLYEAELNAEENASVEVVQKNFEQITRSVFAKNQSKFTASSLATYKSRMQKVLADFDRYSDPVKMNSWNPPVVSRLPKKNAGESAKGKKKGAENDEGSEDQTVPAKPGMHRIDVALHNDMHAQIFLPRDATAQDIKKIQAILAATVGTEE